jgi:hypothetical protein
MESKRFHIRCKKIVWTWLMVIFCELQLTFFSDCYVPNGVTSPESLEGRFLPPVMYRFYLSILDGKCGTTSQYKKAQTIWTIHVAKSFFRTG